LSTGSFNEQGTISTMFDTKNSRW